MESTNVDTFDKMSFDITQMDPTRVRVEVYFKVGELKEHLGILYYEKAKVGFSRKPIGMGKWACVDAKVEGLYMKDQSITPTQIVAEGRRLIEEMGI